MEDSQLQDIWRSYEAKLEQSRVLNLQSWFVNLQTMEALQQHKTETMLSKLLRFKIRTAILGSLYCLLLGVLAYGNHFRNPYFTVSIGAICIFNVITVIIYIRQIIMIKQLDYSANITHTQEQLSKLEASTVGLRFLWLQVPFFCTFFWHSSWIHYDSLVFYTAILPPTLILSFLGYFIYRNATPENMHKKWVRRLMMAGPEYSSVIRAKAFLKEIDDFRQELPQPIENQ